MPSLSGHTGGGVPALAELTVWPEMKGDSQKRSSIEHTNLSPWEETGAILTPQSRI